MGDIFSANYETLNLDSQRITVKAIPMADHSYPDFGLSNDRFGRYTDGLF